MKRKLLNLSQLYRKALCAHLKQGRMGSQASAQRLGVRILAGGLQTLDLARLHEETLINEVLPGCPVNKRVSLIKQAGLFFAATITPMEKKQRHARLVAAHLKEFVAALSQRTVELAASNQELIAEVTQRKIAEEALKKSERHYSMLLEKSEHLQEQLRRLSRQILSAQEEERKEISRELHDVIAQTLTGINVRLATLKKEASTNTAGLERNIARTQRLVEKSVEIVHQFARELRPAVLDDLGLIPALHTSLKSFTARTGIHCHLQAFAGVEELDAGRRTVPFRVAQESLTNVARHAKASRVDVNFKKLPLHARMEIKDDGKSFLVERTLRGNAGKRLGLVGMRERVEMIGGTFCVESAPGHGTTVRVEIPFITALKHALKKSGKATPKCP